MPYVANKEMKKYYTIKEVSEEIGVSETLLRYWEKVFPTINPKKSGRNIRQYSQSDIDEIRLVHNLVKVRGMKLQTAKETINKNRQGATSVSDVMNRLEGIRAELVAIKKELDALN